MKKIALIFLTTFFIVIGTTACSLNDFTGTKTNSTVKNYSSNNSATADTISEKQINDLIDKNINYITNVFYKSTLPYKGNPIENSIYEVDSELFNDYNDFKTKLKSVYCDEESERLLNNFPYDGNPLYKDLNGKLCINIDNIMPRGYFVDWTDYTTEIAESNSQMCSINIRAIIEEPGESTKQDYSVNITIIKENGNWVLKNLFY